jgi:hypothetical protein
VHDIIVVTKFKRFGNSLHDLCDDTFVPDVLLDDAFEEVLPFHVLHDDVEGVGVIVDLVNFDDVVMLQLSRLSVYLEQNLHLVLEEVLGVVNSGILGPASADKYFFMILIATVCPSSLKVPITT